MLGADDPTGAAGAGAEVAVAPEVTSGIVSVAGTGVSAGVSVGAGVEVVAGDAVLVAAGAVVTGDAVFVGAGTAGGVTWARTFGVGAYFSTVFNSTRESGGASTSPFSSE